MPPITIVNRTIYAEVKEYFVYCCYRRVELDFSFALLVLYSPTTIDILDHIFSQQQAVLQSMPDAAIRLMTGDPERITRDNRAKARRSRQRRNHEPASAEATPATSSEIPASTSSDLSHLHLAPASSPTQHLITNVTFVVDHEPAPKRFRVRMEEKLWLRERASRTGFRHDTRYSLLGIVAYLRGTPLLQKNDMITVQVNHKKPIVFRARS
ncbi:hypothetical protein AC579_5815 [Pseudocercospora musae]|uniref:Uncharacterized protein n=1 Tax=Pseudocercospora musae TaxID=113226 RepID=A0A139IRR6_9PEZI|nr:hypothetical protein AC579_5815 [Pseudocercospora musae]